MTLQFKIRFFIKQQINSVKYDLIINLHKKLEKKARLIRIFIKKN